MKKKIEREIIQLNLDKEGKISFTEKKHVDYNNDQYEKVDDIEKHGDGEEHTTIFKRKSDGRFFKYEWCYFPDSCGESYDLDNILTEVFPKTTIAYE